MLFLNIVMGSFLDMGKLSPYPKQCRGSSQVVFLLTLPIHKSPGFDLPPLAYRVAL